MVNRFNKKHIYTALAIVVILLGGVFLFLKFKEARIIIRSEDGAGIFVSEDRQQNFQRIGTTQATFTTRTYDTLYIQVSRGESETQQSVAVEGRGVKEVTIELKDLKLSEQVVDESFAYPHFAGDFVYGINPETRSLSFENRIDNSLPDNLYLDLPYVNKVIWEDPDTFAYRSPIEGVGLYINGEKTAPPYTNEGSTRYFDFAKHPQRPLVLADVSEIFKTTGSDLTAGNVEPIIPLLFSGEASLFADNNHIYFTNTTFEDTGGEGGNPGAEETTIAVYDYSGNEQHRFTIADAQVISKVVGVGDGTLLALGEDKVFVLDKKSGSVSPNSFYFQNTYDLLRARGELYILSDSGLWQYEHGSATFYKLSGYPEDEEYVSNSLMFSGPKRALFYSTSPRLQAIREGRSVTGGTYRIPLN